MTVFEVRNVMRDSGGLFSTREKAESRAAYLTKIYGAQAEWHVTEIEVDYYEGIEEME